MFNRAGAAVMALVLMGWAGSAYAESDAVKPVVAAAAVAALPTTVLAVAGVSLLEAVPHGLVVGMMATGVALDVEAKGRCATHGLRPASASRGEEKWERVPGRLIGQVRCVPMGESGA